MNRHDFGRSADGDHKAIAFLGISPETLRKHSHILGGTVSGKTPMGTEPTVPQLVGPTHPSDDKPADGEDPGEPSSPFSVVFLDLKAGPAGGEMALPKLGEDLGEHPEVTDRTSPGPAHEQHGKTEAQGQEQDSDNGRRAHPQDSPKGGTEA
jgi:hypothetical protein